MNILLEIQFPGGTEYFAKTTCDYNSHQYIGRIVSTVRLSENQSPDKTYETDIIQIDLNDHDHRFRDMTQTYDNFAMGNVTAILRKPDGTLLRTTKIQQWSFPVAGEPPGPVWRIQLSHAIDINKDFTQKIDSTTWANADKTAIGQVVPMVYNAVTRIKAWKIDNRINVAKWLLGKAEISTITKVTIGDIKEVDSTFYNNGTPGNDGTYWWVDMGHGNLYNRGNYCLVDVTTPAYTPVEIIDDILDGTITVATNAAFKTWLTSQGYTSANCKYYLRGEMSASEMLQKFCESFECNWRLNSSGEVEFTHIDTTSISPSYTFRPGEIVSFKPSQSYQPKRIKNEITYFYDFDYGAGKFKEQVIYDGDNQGTVGTFADSVEFDFLTESVQAAETAEQRYLLNREPPNTYDLVASTTTNVDIDTVETGELIRVEHPDSPDSDGLLCQVFRKDADTDMDTIALSVEDKNYLEHTWFLAYGDGLIVTGDNYEILV